MKAAIKTLGQNTLSIVIRDLYEKAQAKKADKNCSIEDAMSAEEVEDAVAELLLVYLSKYNLPTDMVYICQGVLCKEDLKQFKDDNIYNYNKLQLLLKKKWE